jgi:hypothetical protein
MLFPIRRARRFRPVLLLFGVVRQEHAYAQLTADRLEARFGFFRFGTPLANVDGWEISGPYRWWRAIGVRGTLFQPEMTFGGSAHGGVCVSLRETVRLWWWPWNASRLYLTLDDLAGFARELERRGIPGRDAR